MKSLTAVRTAITFVLLSLFIVACGGGGGGDGAPSGDGTLSLTPASLSFEAEQNGATPASQVISYNSSNPATYAIYAGAPAGGSLPSYISMNFVSGSNQLRVSIQSTSYSPGTYNTTIRLVTARIDDSVIDIKDVPVSFTVTEATLPSTTNLTFNLVEGEATPPAQSVTLSKAGNPVTPTSISMITGGANFQASISGGQVDVSLTNAALSLTSGRYFGTLRIFHTGGFTNVSLVLDVASQSLSVSTNPSFLIDLSTTTPDLTQNVTIGTNFTPAGAVDWSAAVEAGKPWVMVSPASGDTVTANTLAVTIDVTQIGDLLNRYHNDGNLINHTADITLTSTTPNVQATTITVTLNLDTPHVLTVSPNVAATGSTEEIILRGWGFAALTNQTLNCGAQPATSYTVLSDVEIRAVCPTSVVGSYELEFVNSIGMDRNNASLYVEDATAYSQEVIASTGTKTRIIYDAVRKSIYVANNGNGTLDRLVFDDTILVGSPWLIDNVSVTNIVDIALSTDGTYIDAIESTTGGYRNEINPDDLNLDLRISWGGFRQYNNIVFMSGGESIGTFMGSANAPESPRRTKRNAAGGLLNPSMQNAVIGATRDGRRAVIASKDSSPAVNVYYHDSASGPTMNPIDMVTTGLTRNATSISSDRTGTGWILNNTDVYTDQFVLLGILPATTLVSIMSHDGTVAYTVDSAGTLRKFDLTSVTAQQFAEIGAGTALAADPGNNPVMTISHDGGQIFIAGDQNLVIMTAP